MSVYPYSTELLLFLILYCKQSKLYRITIITDHLYLSKGLVLQQKKKKAIDAADLRNRSDDCC